MCNLKTLSCRHNCTCVCVCVSDGCVARGLKLGLRLEVGGVARIVRQLPVAMLYHILLTTNSATLNSDAVTPPYHLCVCVGVWVCLSRFIWPLIYFVSVYNFGLWQSFCRHLLLPSIYAVWLVVGCLLTHNTLHTVQHTTFLPQKSIGEPYLIGREIKRNYAKAISFCLSFNLKLGKSKYV